MKDFVGWAGRTGVTAERAVSLTAREETEILLLDLGEELPRLPGNGARR